MTPAIGVTGASRPKRPSRLYLDQKDFGRIADALVRQDYSSPDFTAYDQLKRLVTTGDVRIYFSFVHIVEAFRFGDPRSEVALAYCEAVDSLTEGHCIRYPPHLERAELELALAELTGATSTSDKASYPYGQYGQAVTTDGLQLDPTSIGISPDSTVQNIEEMAEQLRSGLPNRRAVRAFLAAPPSAMSAEVESRFGIKAKKILSILVKGSPAERRSFAESLVGNEHFLKRAIAEMSEEAVNEFRQKFSATGFSWTRELLATALAGPTAEKAEVWKRFLDGVMTFTQLVSRYRLTMPELSGVGTTFDSTALISQLRLLQQFEPIRAKALGTPARWDIDIARDMGLRFIQNARDDIRTYAEERGVSAEVLERQLRSDDFKRLPYIQAAILWMRSYLSRHKGTAHARNPDENDFRDLLHCVNAPYVDILATDRFSAEVSRPLEREFGTRIVRSLQEVISEFQVQRTE
jgi:hypothetical protein